jgi:hypothetical protein
MIPSASWAAHFHFLIKYGAILWGNSTTIKKTCIIQKQVFRTVLGTGSQDVPVKVGL